MGLIAGILKQKGYGDCSNGGLSSKFDEVVVVNVDGPFVARDDLPEVKLVKRPYGNIVAIPVELEGKWTMFGGTYIETSDSRFNRAVEKMSGYKFGFPVALHDRVETAEEYARNSA